MTLYFYLNPIDTGMFATSLNVLYLLTFILAASVSSRLPITDTITEESQIYIFYSMFSVGRRCNSIYVGYFTRFVDHPTSFDQRYPSILAYPLKSLDAKRSLLTCEFTRDQAAHHIPPTDNGAAAICAIMSISSILFSLSGDASLPWTHFAPSAKGFWCRIKDGRIISPEPSDF